MAFYWYQKSADQNNSDAQNQLGFFFENGWGIEMDLKMAFY
ncbi:8103_t:CDS:1, partial [Funneliformis geosporum]